MKKLLVVLALPLLAQAAPGAPERSAQIFTVGSVEKAFTPNEETPQDWSSSQVMQQLEKTADRLKHYQQLSLEYIKTKAEITANIAALKTSVEKLKDINKNVAENLDKQAKALEKQGGDSSISQWELDARKVCTAYTDKQVSVEATSREFEIAQAQNVVDKINARNTCLNQLKEGLQHDKKYVECEAIDANLIAANNCLKNKTISDKDGTINTKFQELDISKIDTYLEENKMLLAAAELDLKVEKKDASHQDMNQYFLKEEAFANLFTEEVWYPVLYVGTKFSPEY